MISDIFKEIVNKSLLSNKFKKEKKHYVYYINNDFKYVINIDYNRHISDDEIKCYSIEGGLFSDIYLDIITSKKHSKINYSSENLLFTNVYRDIDNPGFIEVSENVDIKSIQESIDNAVKHHVHEVEEYEKQGVVKKLLEQGGLLESILASVFTKESKDIEVIKNKLHYLNRYWKSKLINVIDYFPNYVKEQILDS